MNVITGTCENGRLLLKAAGRIDSANAAQTESEIEALRASFPHEEAVLDAEELAYISSAGLRVILRLRKNEPSLKIVNVSGDVYDILEMTGFTEMLPVSKAYRRISVDGCEVIGQGANGKVYRIDPDTIVKVYMDPDSLPDIQRERELARRAFVLGIPTAIPYDVVKVGEGYGSVFELLNARSFAKLIKAYPENLDEYIGLYVELLKKIHSTVVSPDDMPDMKAVALDWAEFLKPYLPADKAEKLIALVKNVPEDNHMMHGDYHIKNVMLQNGETLLIDMDTLCHGHPVFELASMFNAYIGFTELDHDVTEKFLGIPYETGLEIWRKSLPLYLGTEDEETINAVAEKAMLIGYVRLMRRSIRRSGASGEAYAAEIGVYKDHILRLLDKIDTLTF